MRVSDAPLRAFGFNELDRIQDVYRRYFTVHFEHLQKKGGTQDINELLEAKGRLENLFTTDKEIGELGCKMTPVHGLRGREAKLKSIEILKELEEILNYKFRDPEILLASVTHPSGKAHY